MTKAAPRTSPDYDPEMSAMKQCKNILSKLPSAKRQRVLTWLASVVMDSGEPGPHPPSDTRQTTLGGFDLDE